MAAASAADIAARIGRTSQTTDSSPSDGTGALNGDVADAVDGTEVRAGDASLSDATQSDATQSDATQSDATRSDATRSDATQSDGPASAEDGAAASSEDSAASLDGAVASSNGAHESSERRVDEGSEAAGGTEDAASGDSVEQPDEDVDQPHGDAETASDAESADGVAAKAPPAPAEKSRPRAPRFPPGAARPGEAELPPAYGGPLAAAVADRSTAPSDEPGTAPDAPEGPDSTEVPDESVQADAARDVSDETMVGGPAVPGAAAAESDDGGSGKGSFLRRRPVVIAGAAIAGLLLIYGAAYAVAGSGLARNASVLGVDVGGMSPDDAQAKLAAELPELVDEPITVESGDEELALTLVPSEVGLSVDVPATVESIPGGNANPVSLVRALFGGGEVEPIPEVDRAALTEAVEGIGEQFDVDPVNGSVAFSDAEVVTSAAEVGSAVDVEATADLFEERFFGAEEPATLPIGSLHPVITPVEPAITDAEVERAVAEFAEPAMSGPVTVTASEHTVEITPAMLSAALTMVAGDGGRLVPELDPGDLAAAAADVLAEVGQPGKDATIEIRNGTPTVVADEVGVGIAPNALAEALLPVLTASGSDRVATVEFEEIEPEFTAADAEALGVKEVVSEFTTTFVPSSYRNTNIGLAASKINNTLLLPGDTFSLNGLVGERTEANGFARGGVIEGGQLIEAVGGGVSQVATTTYHAAFQAGLEDVEHKPHSIYYDHYPVGQEATVSWGNFDMAFKNDTPYGVLVETIFTPSMPNRGSLTVRLWSTEHFKVETSTSERHSFTSPPPKSYNSSSNCVPNSPSRGFSITSYRKVWDPDGTLVKDESYPWTYRPSPEVVCGEEPSGD